MKVLVLGNVHPKGLHILTAFADVTVLPEPVARDDVLAHIGDVDGMLHKVGRIDAEIIAGQSRLRVIARHGVGLDDLDLRSIAAAGIPVSTTETANSNAVAEATVGYALSLLRHFGRADDMVKHDHSWARESLMGRELSNCTVGVVGYGRIGRLVAGYLAAFGADVLINDDNDAALTDIPYRAASLDELLRTSDVVSLHCPLTPKTRHLIDGPRLKLMHEHAVLINTARGALIDQDALAEALTERAIGGAALDVFEAEPPNFDDPLFACPNLITTPHVAAMTFEAQTAMAVQAASEIRKVLVEGRKPSNNVATTE